MELWLNPKILLTILLVGICVATDLRQKKVLNSVVIAGGCIALLTILIVDGRSGLWPALGSLVAATVFAMPLYIIKAVGAGDVKLLMVISLFLTWDQVATMIVAALVWGSLLGLVRVILAGSFRQFLQNLFSIITLKKQENNKLNQVPFTVAIMFGFLTSIGLSAAGISWV
jgi:prepilin peptidase CpaA